MLVLSQLTLVSTSVLGSLLNNLINEDKTRYASKSEIGGNKAFWSKKKANLKHMRICSSLEIKKWRQFCACVEITSLYHFILMRKTLK